MRVVVLTPWRSDGGQRDLNYEFTKPRIEALGYPVYEGDATSNEWCWAEAANRAAHAAGEWDKAIIHEADPVIDPAQIREGLTRTADLVFCYSKVGKPTQSGNRRIYAGRTPRSRDMKAWHRTWVGGVRIISRRLWEDFAGFDERFRQWGAEDTCFSWAAQTLATTDVVEGVVYSLWHPPTPRTDEFKLPRLALKQEYRAAIGDRKKMRELITESSRHSTWLALQTGRGPTAGPGSTPVPDG